jgi:hypothetical protein
MKGVADFCLQTTYFVIINHMLLAHLCPKTARLCAEITQLSTELQLRASAYIFAAVRVDPNLHSVFMKRITLCLFIGIFYLSCKKEDVIVVNPPLKTTLRIDQVINDSTIVLTWNKFTGTHFKQYRLMRTAMYLKDDKFGTFSEAVDSSTDVNNTSFTENKMPLARDLTYQLLIETDTLPRRYVAASSVTYRRPNSLIYCLPTDVMISKSMKRLYITEQQKIHIVDYTNGRPVNTKEFPISIGFCSLGTYNGNDELYVPLNDGWLEILDANTLQLKERIYVAGYGIGSVVAANGKLFVSSSDRSFSGYSNCLKVFDRATKNLITRTGYWEQTRVVLLEGTNVEMIDLTINLSPVDLSYYQFTPDGALLAKKQDSYHGDFYLNNNIVRSFPDGSRFITSAYGTVFNKSLGFDRYLKQYGTYTDFAFNDDGSIVYAANGTQKKIDIITYPATTNTGNYATKFYPYKIFRDGNSLISVSRTEMYQQNSYIMIENIKL